MFQMKGGALSKTQMLKKVNSMGFEKKKRKISD